MANSIKGRVLEVRPTQSIPTKKGTVFSKRELILDCTKYDPYTGQRSEFDNTPVFTFTQDRCSLLDTIAPDMIVEVFFDIQGARSTDPEQPGRYFNDVRGYRVDVLRPATQPYHQPQYQQQPMQPSCPQQQPYQQPPMPQPTYAAPQDPYGAGQPQSPQYPPQSGAQQGDGLPF